MVLIPQSTRMQKMKDFWEEGWSGWEEYIMMAQKGYGFYKGGDDQWDAADIIALNEAGRPHLSINLILPTINLITGYERQNRQDTKVFPKRGGNLEVADLLTALTKHVEDTSNGLYERSMVFFDGIIARKGWIGIDISYEEDPFNGEIRVIRKNPFDIVEDPNCQNYDINKGGKYVIESYWTDKEMGALTFPKSKVEIDKMKYDDLDSRDVMHLPGSNTNPDRFKARMRETWWKSYEKAIFFCDRLTLERKRVHKSKLPILQRIMEIDRRDAEAEGRADRYQIREAVIPVLNCTTTMGEIELEHVVRPFGEMTKFPLMRFTPYWINGDMFSVVDNLISPQQEKNKRRSQSLHLVNTSANSGFFNVSGDEGADKDELEMFGSKPGVVIEYKSVKPEKIEPTKLSSAHIELEQLAGNDIKEISSINNNLQGQGKSGESGILDRQRQNQGLIGSEIVFDNYKLTHQIYSETMVELIRTGQTFSPQEVLAIAGDAKIDKNVDEILQSLQSIKVGKYGCKVSKSPNNPTTRQANLDLLLAIAEKFPEVIPPSIIIESSDVHQKEQILEAIKVREQQAAQAQKMLAQAELNKSQPKKRSLSRR